MRGFIQHILCSNENQKDYAMIKPLVQCLKKPVTVVFPSVPLYWCYLSVVPLVGTASQFDAEMKKGECEFQKQTTETGNLVLSHEVKVTYF